MLSVQEASAASLPKQTEAAPTPVRSLVLLGKRQKSNLVMAYNNQGRERPKQRRTHHNNAGGAGGLRLISIRLQGQAVAGRRRAHGEVPLARTHLPKYQAPDHGLTFQSVTRAKKVIIMSLAKSDAFQPEQVTNIQWLQHLLTPPHMFPCLSTHIGH